MRTKLILTTAALGVASLSALGQVYSVNAVGYINITVPNGKLMMAANQLNTGGNTAAEVIPAPPDGAILYTYAEGSGFAINAAEFGSWSVPTMNIAPGKGFFIANNSAAPVTITFVGEVPQGANLSTPLVAGLNLVASQVPQAGGLVANLGYVAQDGDIVYQWDATAAGTGAYKAPNGFEFGGWATGEPQLAVGEGFFLTKSAAGSWTRNFSVN